MVGMQVLAVVNFPPRQIADFMSEVVLITPQRPVRNGDRLG